MKDYEESSALCDGDHDDHEVPNSLAPAYSLLCHEQEGGWDNLNEEEKVGDLCRTKTICWRFILPFRPPCRKRNQDEQPIDGQYSNLEEHEVCLKILSEPATTRLQLSCTRRIHGTDPHRGSLLIIHDAREYHSEGRLMARDSGSLSEFEWEISPDSRHSSCLPSSIRQVRLVAYSVPSPVFRQYDLLIDGTSFFTLPLFNETFFIANPTMKDHGEEKKDEMDGEGWSSSNEFQKKRQRRTMASPCSSSDVCSHFKHSRKKGSPCKWRIKEHLYKWNVSGVEKVSVRVPPSHEPSLRRSTMTSDGSSRRMNVDFIDDHHHLDDSPSVANIETRDIPCAGTYSDTCENRIEADCLREAYEFIVWSDECCDGIDKVTKARREFLQTKIESMVSNVVNGQLVAAVATRVSHNMAMMLGFRVGCPVSSTVVLIGLNEPANPNDIYNELYKFGDIDAISLSSGGRGFGMCRFKHKSSAEASSRYQAIIQGIPVRILSIQHSPRLVAPSRKRKSNSIETTMSLSKVHVSSSSPKILRFLRKMFKGA